MLVSDLVALLSALPPHAPVVVAVGWSADTAHSDEGEELIVREDEHGLVTVRGWLSGCGTTLVVEDGG